MAEVIEQTRATMVHFVPSMLSVFVDVVGVDRISRMDSVRIISMTGEAVPPAVAADVAGSCRTSCSTTLYGPTEAAIEITAENIDQVSASDEFGADRRADLEQFLAGARRPAAARSGRGAG